MRTWLVITLMALSTAARLQHDAVSWGAAREAFRAAANEDVYALRDDTRSLGYQIYFAPAWIRSQWLETRASLETLRADARADARRCSSVVKTAAERLSPSKNKR